MRRALLIIIFFGLPRLILAQQSVPAWKTYYDSAQLYWSKDWSKAIPLLTKAEKAALYDLGLYDENYLTILNDLGLAYARQKDFVTAERLLTKSLSVKQELNNSEPTDLSRTLLNLGTIHAEQNHFQQADQFYKKVLAIKTPTLDADVRLQTVKSMVSLYENENKIDDAHRLVSEAYAKGELPIDLQLVRIRLERKSGRYKEAKAGIQQLVREVSGRTDAGSKKIYLQSLLEEGLLEFETGLLNKAEKTFLNVLKLTKEQKPVDNSLSTEVLNNLASVYEKFGLPDKALVYYQDALVLSKDVYGTNSLNTLTIQSNIAGIQLKQSALNEAINSYTAIEKTLSKTSGQSSLYITILNNLATAYRAGGRSKEAQEMLQRARTLMENAGLTNDDLYASIMNNIAVLLTASGKTSEAIGYYEKAYSIRKAIYGDNSVLLMDLASNMAVVYWELKKPDLSIPLFQKSNSLAIRQIKYIFPNLSEDEQVLFYKKLKEDFERFNTIAVGAGKSKPELLTQVFNNQITIKSLLFFTQRHRKDLITQKNDTVLDRQYEELKMKREQLGYIYQLPLKNQSEVQVDASTLEKEIDVLEKSISLKTSETLAEKMMEQSPTWNDVQASIQSDAALVEIIRFRKYDLKKYTQDNATRVSFGFTDSVYYAALITTRETKTSPALVLMKEGQNMETRFLNYYRNALKYGVQDENSFPFYWKPFQSAIAGKTQIYLSGDGVYHRLNLNTLYDRESGKYVLEQYNIHYLLNPAQVLEPKSVKFTSRNATLVGDPVFDFVDADAKNRSEENFSTLPGTLVEVTKINDILKARGWSTQVYLKKVATERNLKNTHSPDILHIATHGFFSSDKVKLSAGAKKDYLFYSGLVLTGANKSLREETPEFYDDGILTAYEVMNLDLNHTHLVVLSACETGLGKIENGEGVYGLQRSFLQAGARNILISLWKVDDQITQELMVKFYQYLFQGKSEREALKLAQLDIIKKDPRPLGWGGFILVGLD